MKLKRIDIRTGMIHRPREILRDPAVWAWLFVALLAILPARAVLAGT
jgi:hypothetical protein